MQKIKKSTCSYCGSVSFGPGCQYAPHGKHVHCGDPKRCIYCGSFTYGPGCQFSPHGKHVHGSEYNQMINDATQSGIIVGYLMKKLIQPLTETNAYKLGLIDKNGCKLKQPQTLEEKASLTSIDEYLFDIRRTLGSKLDIINNATYLKYYKLQESQTQQSLEAEYETKKQIENVIKELYNIGGNAYQKGVDMVKFERLIIEALTENKNV